MAKLSTETGWRLHGKNRVTEWADELRKAARGCVLRGEGGEKCVPSGQA